MAKRGPKPKTQFPGPSVVFSSRMAPELKAELEKAAAARGGTLSDEIQRRLRRTFSDDEKIADNFGDSQTYMMMRTIALAVQWSGVGTAGLGNWLSDPAWFDNAVKTINRLLEAVRPEGDPRPNIKGPSPSDIDAVLAYTQDFVSSALWLEIQDADPSAPINKGTRYEHKLRLIKDEIGHVAARSKTGRDDLLKMADDLKRRKDPK
ncbi:hypothetical protein [Mesorhizobium sp.]|uniref:hypothetical protein n=1 Tax=Mesorhizobium sp. TaxID=1871066 RepID=UPI000FE7B32B|nr:hypothetical protein [Mesorhizobium sp.]RWM08944.1 MAG: hypothetical protein EOR71_10545 [Mesorhizobium sp.]